MDRYIWRAGLVLVVLSLVATGAFATYDITGGPSAGWAPEWWNWDGISKLRAEWNADATTPDPATGAEVTTGWKDTVGEGWVDGVGAPPDDWEIQGYPNIHAPFGGEPGWYSWSQEAQNSANVNDDGILMPGGSSYYEWVFDLAIGNEYRPDNEKFWYLELELPVPTRWFDHYRLDQLVRSYKITAAGEWDDLTADQIVGEGWVGYAADGTRLGDPYATPSLQGDTATLVWWGYYHIIPQPELEKLVWHWDLNTVDAPNDTRINRVLVGTYCTPEPITMALLALGLPLGLLARRRRKED